MCGRYRLTAAQRFKERFETENELELPARYNIAPTQDVPVVRQDPKRPVRRASTMRWGLIPFWANDPSIGAKLINARSETVADKSAFREAFRSRRCLVPADGFYEWKRTGKVKQPFHIGMADDSVFAFAGIWDRWKNEAGQWVETVSILTTQPNELVRDLHDRMPAILEREDYDLWLDPGFHDVEALLGMLKPYDAAAMKRYPVSPRVNQVANDDAECAAEIKPEEPTEPPEAQGSLF